MKLSTYQKLKKSKNIDDMLAEINIQMEIDKEISAIGLRFIFDIINEYGKTELDEIEGNRLEFMKSILNKSIYFEKRKHLKLVV